MMRVQKAGASDVPALASLALLLWPSHMPDELEAEFAELALSADAALFLAVDGQTPVAFAQCQVRRDYVEGTGGGPVGYLEGIYVLASHRRHGVARRLITACGQWALEMGCREMASDCELGNHDSLQFHLGAGFKEANRIICFVKPLS